MKVKTSDYLSSKIKFSCTFWVFYVQMGRYPHANPGGLSQILSIFTNYVALASGKLLL